MVVPFGPMAHCTMADLRGEASLALAEAVAAYFAERDLAPTSRRVYALTLERLVARFGAVTSLRTITPRTLAGFTASEYGHLAAASWNVLSLMPANFVPTC